MITNEVIDFAKFPPVRVCVCVCVCVSPPAYFTQVLMITCWGGECQLYPPQREFRVYIARSMSETDAFHIPHTPASRSLISKGIYVPVRRESVC